MHTRFFEDAVQIIDWKRRLKLYWLGLIGRVQRISLYEVKTWKFRGYTIFKWSRAQMKGWQEWNPPHTMYITWVSKEHR